MKDFIALFVLVTAAAVITGAVWSVVTFLLITDFLVGIVVAVGFIILGVITWFVWYE